MRRYYAYVTVSYKVSNLSATLGLCATLFVLSASLVSSHLYEASGWWLSCQFNSNLVSTCVIPELPFTLKTCNFLGGPGIVIGGHNHVLSGKIPSPRPFVCPFDFRDTFCSDEDMFFFDCLTMQKDKNLMSPLCPGSLMCPWYFRDMHFLPIWGHNFLIASPRRRTYILMAPSLLPVHSFIVMPSATPITEVYNAKKETCETEETTQQDSSEAARLPLTYLGI